MSSSLCPSGVCAKFEEIPSRLYWDIHKNGTYVTENIMLSVAARDKKEELLCLCINSYSTVKHDQIRKCID